MDPEIKEIDRSKNVSGIPQNPLSKNQQKKVKKLKEYEQKKKERRIREREKRKLKRKMVHENAIRIGPSRKELKKRSMKSPSVPLIWSIDLDFDDLMSERDVSKCVKQCLRIYTVNRRSTCPGHLHFTGIKKDGNIHASLKKNDGWENWNVHYHLNQSYKDIFPKDKIVYLTCESDTVLEKLEQDHVYVIGGLVDHNHQKGLCHQRATDANIKTARLPLSEFVEMKTRSVLSTFHVFEILVRISEGKSWTDAILETIPSRKGAKPKKALSEGTACGNFQKSSQDRGIPVEL